MKHFGVGPYAIAVGPRSWGVIRGGSSILDELRRSGLSDRPRHAVVMRPSPGSRLIRRRPRDDTFLVMSSERQKMLAGELYDPLDPELVAARARARDLCQGLD